MVKVVTSVTEIRKTLRETVRIRCPNCTLGSFVAYPESAENRVPTILRGHCDHCSTLWAVTVEVRA